MWHEDKKVISTYSTRDSQNAWANIETLGWRKIRPGAEDGVTNTFVLLNAAKANERTIDVFVDANDRITRALMK